MGLWRDVDGGAKRGKNLRNTLFGQRTGALHAPLAKHCPRGFGVLSAIQAHLQIQVAGRLQNKLEQARNRLNVAPITDPNYIAREVRPVEGAKERCVGSFMPSPACARPSGPHIAISNRLAACQYAIVTGKIVRTRLARGAE